MNDSGILWYFTRMEDTEDKYLSPYVFSGSSPQMRHGIYENQCTVSSPVTVFVFSLQWNHYH